MSALVETFLTDLAHANRSPHTLKAYRLELARFAAFWPGPADHVWNVRQSPRAGVTQCPTPT